jgi:hypothetical protein
MSEAKAGAASESRLPAVIDAPASGETAIRLLPTPTNRRLLAATATQSESAVDEEALQRFSQLPKEAGWLLITAGVVGLAVPGILGTPFLLAGAVVVVPGGPKLLSRWVGRHPPRIVHSAMRQISRFIDDLERRYPRR